jgi:hypothetical protein
MRVREPGQERLLCRTLEYVFSSVERLSGSELCGDRCCKKNKCRSGFSNRLSRNRAARPSGRDVHGSHRAASLTADSAVFGRIRSPQLSPLHPASSEHFLCHQIHECMLRT